MEVVGRPQSLSPQIESLQPSLFEYYRDHTVPKVEGRDRTRRNLKRIRRKQCCGTVG